MAALTPSTTHRGFKVYHTLTDTYGSEVRVQESSIVGRPCCWVFASSEHINEPSPHLNVAQARELIQALEAFIADAEDPANWRNDPEYMADFG